MSINQGPSARRLRDLLGAPRDQVAYHHDAMFHATVELVCQLLDVVDNVTDADAARAITDEFAALLTSEHAEQAHQRIQEMDEAKAQSALFGREARNWAGSRRLSPAAEVMTGYHGPREQKHGQADCPNFPHGCRVCTPVHDITVHVHSHEHGTVHDHPHRHPARKLFLPPAPSTEEELRQWREELKELLGMPPLRYQILDSGTESIPYRDMIENLASVNELLAELTREVAADSDFALMTRDILRKHSWRLGMQFQGEMGDPDAAVPVPGERAGADGNDREVAPGGDAQPV